MGSGPLDSAAIARLTAEVAGPVLLPDAVDQVAVRFAAERGLPVAVLATGHQLGRSAEGSVLINLSRMNALTRRGSADLARLATRSNQSNFATMLSHGHQVVRSNQEENMSPFTIRPPQSRVRAYRAAGVWRDYGSIGYLRRWRDQTPQALAVSAFGPSDAPVEISYHAYAHLVERFSGALYELGVRPGHVVAIQLPNWWQALVLFQAPARLGAVLAPRMTTIGPRELKRMLRRVQASVCITVDGGAGFGHAEALRDMASRLPTLRYRIVLGRAGKGDIEFTPVFEQTPWEQRHPVALDDAREDPDAVSVVLFTSGTSGEPRAALHTKDTLFTTTAGVCEVMDIESSDVLFSPHAQAQVNRERLQRESNNREDMVAFLVPEQKLSAVGQWEAQRHKLVRPEAEQRRAEQRPEGARALARMRHRGETVADIAQLGGRSMKLVRRYLKELQSAAPVSGGTASGNGSRARGSDGIAVASQDSPSLGGGGDGTAVGVESSTAAAGVGGHL